MSATSALGLRPIALYVPTAAAPSSGPARAQTAAGASASVTLSGRAPSLPGHAAAPGAERAAQQFIASLADVLAAGESTHFMGKGKVSTADGDAFEFEAEVRYEAMRVDAAAGSRHGVDAPDALALMGKQLPEVKFPGSLSDLFKLFDREVQFDAPRNPIGSEAGATGVIALRLVRLVNSAALIAPRARADDPQASAAQRSDALARAYGTAPPVS